MKQMILDIAPAPAPTLDSFVSGRNGDTPIENGKIDGDRISFTVTRKFNDMEIKMNYTGKVSGDSIKLNYKQDFVLFAN